LPESEVALPAGCPRSLRGVPEGAIWLRRGEGARQASGRAPSSRDRTATPDGCLRGCGRQLRCGRYVDRPMEYDTVIDKDFELRVKGPVFATPEQRTGERYDFYMRRMVHAFEEWVRAQRI